MAQKDLEWITPLLGFVGLLAGTLFFTSNNNSNSSNNSNNTLPPPPPTKEGDCGCMAGKKN